MCSEASKKPRENGRDRKQVPLLDRAARAVPARVGAASWAGGPRAALTLVPWPGWQRAHGRLRRERGCLTGRRIRAARPPERGTGPAAVAGGAACPRPEAAAPPAGPWACGTVGLAVGAAASLWTVPQSTLERTARGWLTPAPWCPAGQLLSSAWRLCPGDLQWTGVAR